MAKSEQELFCAWAMNGRPPEAEGMQKSGVCSELGHREGKLRRGPTRLAKKNGTKTTQWELKNIVTYVGRLPTQ